jgi:hypothetical protein
MSLPARQLLSASQLLLSSSHFLAAARRSSSWISDDIDMDDFKNAFDCIDRPVVWKALRLSSTNSKAPI